MSRSLMMKESLLLDFQIIKSPSQIGKMGKTIFSMRSILNIHFILFHSKVSQITKPIILRSNNKNWKSIIRCLLLSVKSQMPWLDWVNINPKLLNPKQQTKRYTRDSSYKVAQKYKLRKLKLSIPRLYQVISIHTTRRNSSDIITSRANLIKFHIRDINTNYPFSEKNKSSRNKEKTFNIFRI